MKAKQKMSARHISDGLDSVTRQKRLDVFLKSTQTSFEKSVENSLACGPVLTGVLVGPVKRT